MMHMRKVMKTIGICSMAAIMMAGLSGCGGKTGGAVSSGAKNVAKIGFTAALTGGAAAYGKSEEEGVRLAVEEINKKGDFPIDLLVEDTKAVPADSMNATKKLIQEKVSMIIGPMTSNEAKAAGPIIQNAKVPSLEISVTAENITDIGDCIFRNSVPESKNIPQTVQKTHKLLGYKNVAVLYSNNNEHQVSAYKTFVKALEAEGVNIVATETFADKDTDFSAQLTKIHNVNPDAVVVAGYYQEGGLILKKMREMGMDQPVLGDNGFVSPELGKMAGAAADNVYVSSMWSADRKDEKVQKFVENYTKAYGRAPDQFAASAYDGVYMAMDAMKRAGTTTDHKKIRDALAQIKDFKGVCGTFSFDEKRDPVVDLILMTLQVGKFGVVDVK